jgi:CBS domain-containing protein
MLRAQNYVVGIPVRLGLQIKMEEHKTARMAQVQQSWASCALPGQLPFSVSAMNANLRSDADLRTAHLREVAMQVGDILRKRTARVATVRMNETVAIAAQLMRASNIGALVVKDVVRTEGNTAVGMFTERDVVRAIAEHGAAGVNLKVSQLISVQQLVWCDSTDTLEHVHHLMNSNHIRHLPVIDNYSLIGVISVSDISTAFDDGAAAASSVPA